MSITAKCDNTESLKQFVKRCDGNLHRPVRAERRDEEFSSTFGKISRTRVLLALRVPSAGQVNDLAA